MARRLNKLCYTRVRSNSLKPGYYGDGGGLYLQVGPSGNKNWTFRYQRLGRCRELGLGPSHAVSLSRARERAMELRGHLAEGKDPLAVKRAALAAERGTVTFREAEEAYIAAHAPGWRNAKHASQWQNTLASDAFPVLGDLPVGEIDTALVLKVLSPIWTTRTETAKRLRGRIESILDWATARHYRTGENPARWRGHLDKLLAKPSKVRGVVSRRQKPVRARLRSWRLVRRAPAVNGSLGALLHDAAGKKRHCAECSGRPHPPQSGRGLMIRCLERGDDEAVRIFRSF